MDDTYEEDSAECSSKFRAVALDRFEQGAPDRAEREGVEPNPGVLCSARGREVELWRNRGA